MADYGFDSTTYDNEDRLMAWSRVDDAKDQEWDLSLVGNWDEFTEEGIGVARTHNEVHEISAIGATSLSSSEERRHSYITPRKEPRTK